METTTPRLLWGSAWSKLMSTGPNHKSTLKSPTPRYWVASSSAELMSIQNPSLKSWRTDLPASGCQFTMRWNDRRACRPGMNYLRWASRPRNKFQFQGYFFELCKGKGLGNNASAISCSCLPLFNCPDSQVHVHRSSSCSARFLLVAVAVCSLFRSNRHSSTLLWVTSVRTCGNSARTDSEVRLGECLG